MFLELVVQLEVVQVVAAAVLQLEVVRVVVLLVVFAMKTATFPLFFWLPDSYPVVPAGVRRTPIPQSSKSRPYMALDITGPPSLSALGQQTAERYRCREPPR